MSGLFHSSPAMGLRSHTAVFLSAVVFSFISLSVQAQTTTVPGKVPGEFSVSPSGAATYRIPIQLPPGIAGMEPRLALSYNSQAGNGIMGLGWSLEGLSVITRCPKTMATDGFRSAITHTPEDRFCIDGQRLINVTGAYGTAGSEYRTEIDSFSKVIANGAAVGNAANGPESFTVKTKAGLIMEYGTTVDSRIELQKATVNNSVLNTNTIRAWALNKVADAKGNSIEFSYTKNQGYLYPSQIKYGGVLIRFNLNLNTHSFASYQAGVKSIMANRISSIEILLSGSSQAAYTYYLKYKADSPGESLHSRLESVRFCTSDQTCFAESQFSWSSDSAASTNISLTNVQSHAANDHRGWMFVNAEINGDSKSDLIAYTSGDHGLLMQFLIGAGNGGFTALPRQIISTDSHQGRQVEFIDLNGDGLTDSITQYVGAYGLRTQTRLMTASGYLETKPEEVHSSHNHNGYQPIYHDINGDGLIDMVVQYIGAYGLRLKSYFGRGDGVFIPGPEAVLSTENHNGRQVIFDDVNGDGLADVLNQSIGVSGLNIKTYLGDGSGFFSVQPFEISSSGSFDQWKLLYTDLNADQVLDVLAMYVGTHGVQARSFIGLGTGEFLLPSINIYSTDNYSAWDWKLMDFNADGRIDVHLHHIGSLGLRTNILRNLGGGIFEFGNIVTQASVNNTDWQVLVGDTDGVGRTDFILTYARSDGVKTRSAIVNSLAKPSVIFQTQNSLNQVSVEYRVLTQSVYVKDTTSTYPLVDIQPPLSVVSSVTQSNGVGGTNRTNYSYGGLKAEHASIRPEHAGSGRGSLGFRWMKSREEFTGIESYTEFRQDWPYIGMVKSSETRLVKDGVNQLLKRSVSTPACYQSEARTGTAKPAATAACTPWARERVYFPFIASSTEESWDLNSVQMPTLFSQSLYGGYADQTGVARQFGDPTQITVDIRENGVLKQRKVTSNQYLPAKTEGQNWQSGRLNRASVISTQY